MNRRSPTPGEGEQLLHPRRFQSVHKPGKAWAFRIGGCSRHSRDWPAARRVSVLWMIITVGAQVRDRHATQSSAPPNKPVRGNDRGSRDEEPASDAEPGRGTDNPQREKHRQATADAYHGGSRGDRGHRHPVGGFRIRSVRASGLKSGVRHVVATLRHWRVESDVWVTVNLDPCFKVKC